jgi:hypothetical protein
MDPAIAKLIARLSDPDQALSAAEIDYLGRALVQLAEEIGDSPSDEQMEVLQEAARAAEQLSALKAGRQGDAQRRAAWARRQLAAVSAAAEAPTPPDSGRVPVVRRLAARSPRSSSAARGLRAAARVLTSDGSPAERGESAAELFGRRLQHELRSRTARPEGAEPERVTLARVAYDWPEERSLGSNEEENERLIEGVVGPQALVASGGICAPVAVDYAVAPIADSARPLRDEGALASFSASRGGVRYVLPHTLAAVTVDGPSIVWTAANDANPTAPATKPHATFSCQPVQEALVDAVTSIVQFGNFQQRFFPEQVEQYMRTADAVHSRLAEATLLEAMKAGSTAVTAGADQLSATRDILAEVDRAAAAYRYRHRTARDLPLRLVYPEWLDDMMRADLARQLPGDSGSGIERLATADTQIDSFFRTRNINTTRYLDSPPSMSGTPHTSTALQGWGIQGAGMLLPWPSVVLMLLFHEGAWMFLDGGELSLGMVRDSTLNRTNDLQVFSETFEKAILRGHESLAITCTVCPSGASAATKDTSSLCLYGS